MKHIITLFICAVIVIAANAQPGSLDENFGTSGIVFGDKSSQFCNAVILQTDGKIIQAGSGGYDGVGGFFLMRYHTDGSSDVSFGDDGRVVTDLPGMSSTVFCLAIQPDGKIVAAGYTITDDVEIALARYKPDGSPDSSFGTNGIIVNKRGSDDYLRGMAIQPDGKIIVTGNASYTESFIFRYMPDGSPDESFGENGQLFTVFPVSMQINAIVLLPDGKIITGGLFNYFSAQPKFMLLQYMPDGSPDIMFGEKGIAKADFGPSVMNTGLYALALQADGKIVSAGRTGEAPSEKAMALIRFNSNGTVDNSFGDEGKVVTRFANNWSEAKAVLVQPDGKIIAAGRNFDNITFSYFALARYHNNGNLDSSFGNYGVQVTNMGGSGGVEDAALQEDGKIIAAGDIYEEALRNNSFVLARYNGGDEVLAATYKAFTASQNAQGIMLNWQTAQETNNAYFSVERSAEANAAGYTVIARVNSNGGSTAVQQYAYTDKFPLAGGNYYRIKQTDADGRYSYSAVVHINFTGAGSIKIFPNPAGDLLTVQGLQAGETNRLSLHDMQGRLLQQFTVKTIAYTINVNMLAPGTYMLRVQNSSGAGAYKFVKQ